MFDCFACIHRLRRSSLGNVSLSTEIADQKGLVWLPGFRRRLATTIRSFSLSASYPFKALMSGVLSYGLQDHWDHLRQDTFDVQWVFIDVVSKCHQNEMIEGPEDMSEDLEGSSMQCKLVENREDFTETYPDLCRQHIYAMYWYIFRDYTEEEFYACFEKKFKEKFVKVRKCRLPWDRQENFTHCETILESVRN